MAKASKSKVSPDTFDTSKPHGFARGAFLSLDMAWSCLLKPCSIMATRKTTVLGYFNPNDYPLQIPLRDLNIVLQLQPKDYVVDRSGPRVNDPRLDAYVGEGKLARANDQRQQDVIFLRAARCPIVRRSGRQA